jgi:hypothetical protein
MPTPNDRKRAARVLASAITRNLETNISDQAVADITGQLNLLANAKAALVRVTERHVGELIPGPARC